MPRSRFLEKFHHTHHDDNHRHDTASASASSGRTSWDSKQVLAQSSSPPPYTEAYENQPYGLSSEDQAAETRVPRAIDEKFQMDAGVGASYSSSQSDSRGTEEGPSTARTSLRLCPHEDLTFERLKSIKGMLYEEYLKNGMEIIRNTKEERHEKVQDPDEKWPCKIWACHADNEGRLSTGIFKLKLSSKPHKFFGHKRDPVIGLELRIWWELRVYCASGNSRDQINQFLQMCDMIQLCPHMMMDHPWIQKTVYNFRRVRDVPEPSSMDQYMQYTHKSKPPPPQPPQAHDCNRCKTHVEVSYKPSKHFDVVYVRITRHLGEGVEENDPTWLAQCGIVP